MVRYSNSNATALDRRLAEEAALVLDDALDQMDKLKTAQPKLNWVQGSDGWTLAFGDFCRFVAPML